MFSFDTGPCTYMCCTEQSPGPPPIDQVCYHAGTPYKPSSFGYRVPGQFSTIMAYPCSPYTNCANCAPCPRIPSFR